MHAECTRHSGADETREPEVEETSGRRSLARPLSDCPSACLRRMCNVRPYSKVAGIPAPALAASSRSHQKGSWDRASDGIRFPISRITAFRAVRHRIASSVAPRERMLLDLARAGPAAAALWECCHFQPRPPHTHDDPRHGARGSPPANNGAWRLPQAPDGRSRQLTRATAGLSQIRPPDSRPGGPDWNHPTAASPGTQARNGSPP
ncbi:hypothetical protein B0T16DRAFT_516730 [Cercophora newfieldiana]|uniref:Uncharacterized protein n=1 Tax=Cercophora newfieldiana TaxID=92897 RepID=A0AA40CKC1_9PEZI|nr:hypothetical protein B0T16DRAFT_516730 [Cercophora newfieldiana]